MALRSGYKGFKKLINGLKVLRPGVLGIDIGTGLAIGQDGKLNVTGVDVTVAGNPEEAATAGDLTKLQIGDDIFNVPDTTYSNATKSAAGLMSATDKEFIDDLSTALSFKNHTLVTESGLNFSFERVGNDIIVNISGQATDAIANDAKIIDIPADYQFDLYGGMNVVFDNIASGNVIGVMIVEKDRIKALSPIAIGDKPRGSFIFRH